MRTIFKKARSDVTYVTNYSVYKAMTKTEIDMYFAYVTTAANCSPFC